MGLLAFFRSKPSSAQVAKERLRIIVSQERNRRGGGPDYLPLLRKELLEVIRKYVEHLHVDRPLYNDHNRMKELVKRGEILEEVEKVVGKLG